MRVLFVRITLTVILLCSVSSAQSPPFRKVTIAGKTKADYNKVSLFKSGSSKRPTKTKYISQRDGKYSIDVNIPNDMRKKNDYLYTDMRFWGDKNNNGIKDPGEPISECHFIIWVPSAQIVYLQVYKGAKYKLKSPLMEYNYN